MQIMNAPVVSRVIIANGFKNFHLSSAAAEADKRGALVALFNGLYPKKWIAAIIARLRLSGQRRLKRFFGREVDIDERRVRMFVMADILNDCALLAGRPDANRSFVPKLHALSMRMFGDAAATALRRTKRQFEIYHYRSGFGLASLKEARRKGAILLCDHSIAHPLVLRRLISDRGALNELSDRANLDPMSQLVISDIEEADHVVVNSHFVKDTFRHVGFPTEKLSVVYFGVDDVFLRSIPARRTREPGERLRLMFAGSFCDRKGAAALLDAISRLPVAGWSLSLAGAIEPHLENAVRQAERNYPVRRLGNLTREQLARAMCEADVFVFPSLAEGSARVVFEAMACGCYIVTTPNAGSIVEDGVHGRIVAPGDANALADALNAAIEDRSVAAIGHANAALIGEKYRQRAYGEKMAALYESLARKKAWR